MSKHHEKKQGYVLIAAVAALMIGALWAAYAAQRIVESARTALVLESMVEDRQAAHDGLMGAIYLAATSPLSECGWQPHAPYVGSDFLTPLRDLYAPCMPLDDRPEALAGAEVRLQDTAGLFSVRLPPEALLDRFLSNLAVPPPTWTWGAALSDFVDRDNVERSRGAEAATYRQHGAQGPTNRWPRTPYEAFDALGWQALAQPETANTLGLNLSPSINANTASAETLASIAPFDAESAAAIVAARQREAFVDFSELVIAARGQQPPNPFTLTILSSDSIRVRAGSVGRAPVLEANISRPNIREALPWSLDYVITTPEIAIATGNGANAEPSLPADSADPYGPWLNERP